MDTSFILNSPEREHGSCLSIPPTSTSINNIEATDNSKSDSRGEFAAEANLSLRRSSLLTLNCN